MVEGGSGGAVQRVVVLVRVVDAVRVVLLPVPVGGCDVALDRFALAVGRFGRETAGTLGRTMVI